MHAKALPPPPTGPTAEPASTPSTAPEPGDLIAFIEQFRATHDLVALDVQGFAQGLRDPSPGRDIKL